MLVSLILSFDMVGGKVAEVLKVPAQTLKFWAMTVLTGSLGLYLITSGVAALAVPIVGIGLIVIGLALVAYTVWPFFGSKKAE